MSYECWLILVLLNEKKILTDTHSHVQTVECKKDLLFIYEHKINKLASDISAHALMVTPNLTCKICCKNARWNEVHIVCFKVLNCVHKRLGIYIYILS